MPEIAEVARVVHYLRKTLVGRTLSVVKAQDDANVFGKVGTSGAEFQKSLTGKIVMGACQQGKYFWLIMSTPPHPVFHFGMTGWFYIRGEPSMHYRPKGPTEAEEWPPKYWKFCLQTKEERNLPKVEAAFTDARRFARIRLVDCTESDIRKTTPLKENGPDPVVDGLTDEWLETKMRSKHVPVKAFLLDQANISGLGNWVGDEVLYNAKLHPEQYSDTFSTAQIKQLHTSIVYVCQIAVGALADSSKFPDHWLFNHRWGKGKKDAPTTLPNGEKITFVTVGGRTSCIVPSIQKKTGVVARGLWLEKDGDEEVVTSEKKQRKRKEAEDADVEARPKAPKKPKVTNKRSTGDTQVKAEEPSNEPKKISAPRNRGRNAKPVPDKVEPASAAADVVQTSVGRRRSGRVSKT